MKRPVRRTMPARNHAFRPPRGYTMMEVLVATALMLTIMLAVAWVFGMVGETIADSRSSLEMTGQLRSAANQAGRLAIRPGMPAQEVDRVARRAITLAGYGQYFIHRTGHGLGLEVHEPPYMVEGNLEILQPGMTFTVEPGIYLPGVGGVRIEDNVLVTEEGSTTLTTLPRELLSLG